MSEPRVIDAGPALNFFSINRQTLLIKTMGRLAMPEAVRGEIERKAAGPDKRFERSQVILRTLERSGTLLEILPDDSTPELDAVALRVTRMPLSERRRMSKDFGEVMVVAHAVVAAEAGAVVTVIIDDGGGVEMARAEAQRLQRLAAADRAVGSLQVVGTLDILRLAVQDGLFKDRGELRAVYDRLVGLDDGLPKDIKSTGLLSPQVWAPKPST